MSVVVILGILASVAIPGYRKAMEREYWHNAQDILLTVYSGERAYFFTNNAYYTPGNWREVHVDNPNLGPIPVAFTVTTAAGPPPTFTATATRSDGSGRSMSIDQDRQWCGGATVTSCTGWPMP